jgi:Domain of unknown function (DUF4158)
MGERSSEQLTRYFYLSDSDRSVIAEHRGPHNRLGSGLQLICAGSSGHPFLQQENREEDSLVGRGALQACCQWQPQLSKQRGFLPLMVPRECVLDNPLHCQQGRRKRSAQDPRGVLGMIAEPTGTDGFRLLCHQFFPSCLPHLESCLTSSKTFWLKRNKLKKALLL